MIIRNYYNRMNDVGKNYIFWLYNDNVYYLL